MFVPLSSCFAIQSAECNGLQDILAGAADAIGIRKCGGKVTLARFEQPLVILPGKQWHVGGKGAALLDISTKADHFLVMVGAWRLSSDSPDWNAPPPDLEAVPQARSQPSLGHVKNLLSGIFKYAKRLGAVDGVNPVQDVSIPKGRPGVETYAYSLEEIVQIISVLGQPAATVVATAAFTGMRKGELRGFLWENYSQGAIWVSQSVWESIVDEPKTRKSKSPVPVIGPLARLLGRHREARGNPQSGFVFGTRNGTALNLSNLARRYIRPKLREEGIKWWGWHAFRRVPTRPRYEFASSRSAGQDDSSHSPAREHLNHAE
jgi:integrase